MSLQRVLWVFGAVLAYLLPMGWALATLQYDLARLIALLPGALLVFWLSVVHFDRFLMVMVFFIPLSISVKNVGGGYGASFPGEVFLAFAALVLGFNFLRHPRIDARILKHPFTLLLFAQLFWVVLTTLSSTVTLISAKFLISRISYLLVFYFGFILLFEQREKIVRFIWMYLLGFIPVMLHSLIKLSSMGFSRKYSPEMSRPFYDDHTVFGACIALLLPVAFCLWRERKALMAHIRHSRLIALVLPLLVASLVLSFSRAAWMSVVAAAGFALVLRLRVPFWVLGFAVLSLGSVAYVQRDAIYASMQANENASGEDVLETAKSVTNISTDESNKERLNRWASALRMYEARPWLGFGPGTYEKNYGVYQALAQKTRISTNHGDRGDAHSEYLTALSEQGLPGLAIHLLLLAAMFATGMRVVYRATDKPTRRLAAGILLGILTYLIHGGVNSFLDIDKAASLIWAMAAMLVAMDVWGEAAPPIDQKLV